MEKMYPPEFPVDSRDRVEAAKLIAKRRFQAAKQREFSNQWDARSSDEQAFFAYILEGFLAFGREAFVVADNEDWSIAKIRSVAEEFLLDFALQAHYHDGTDRFGSAFPTMTSNYTGKLLQEVQQRLRKMDEWRKYEDELLAVAERRSSGGCRPAQSADLSRVVEVDDFLKRCWEETGIKVTRKMLWQAIGHESPRQFQYWQKSDERATAQDDQNFRRVLEMKPGDFVQLLRKRSLID